MIKKFLAVTAIFVITLLLVFGKNGIVERASMNRQLADLKERLKDLKTSYVQESNEMYGLNNDQAFLEKRARERLKMSKPSEKIYLFDNDNSEIEAQ